MTHIIANNTNDEIDHNGAGDGGDDNVVVDDLGDDDLGDDDDGDDEDDDGLMMLKHEQPRVVISCTCLRYPDGGVMASRCMSISTLVYRRYSVSCRCCLFFTSLC